MNILEPFHNVAITHSLSTISILHDHYRSPEKADIRRREKVLHVRNG